MSTAFHSMIALPLAVFVYLFLEKRHNDLPPQIEGIILTQFIDYGFTLVAMALTYWSYKQFRGDLSGIKSDLSLKVRFDLYSSFTFKAYTLLGIAFAVLVSGLYITTSTIFIVDYVVLLFLLSLQRPTPDKYIRDLGLEGAEKQIVKNKKEFTD